jgi:hypothetical protein
MKNLKVLKTFFPICLFVLFANQSIAQEKIDWSDFFPLNKGDLWEYDCSVDILRMREVYHVIGDTIMFNNIRYMTVEDYYVDGPYAGHKLYNWYRLDSLGNVYHFRRSWCKEHYWVDTLLYRLSGNIGDTMKTSCIPRIRILTKKYFASDNSDSLLGIEFQTFNDPLKDIRLFWRGLGMKEYHYEGGDLSLRGAIIKGVTYGSITVGVQDRKITEHNLPAKYILSAYPNPFNSQTTVTFQLRQRGHISLEIYDILGRKIFSLTEGVYDAGSHLTQWNGKDQKGAFCPSGVYFIVFRTSTRSLRQSVSLIR